LFSLTVSRLMAAVVGLDALLERVLDERCVQVALDPLAMVRGTSLRVCSELLT
jgi:hypothetical protein